MSAAAQTRVFGLKLSVPPKLLVGAMLSVALLLFWYNSQDDGGVGNSAVPGITASVDQSSSLAARAFHPPSPKQARGSHLAATRGVLRVRPVDPTKGDIDPTVRLDLLAKMQSLNEPLAQRNLFEIEAEPVAAPVKITGPVIMPEPLSVSLPVREPIAIPMQASIPFKYYGFIASPQKDQHDRGLFLDGDNVLVASKGDFVKGRYRVLELTPLIARIEDSQVKIDQVLSVASPVAASQ